MSTPALSSKARAALDAICDTFAPGGDGLPSATELGVPEALLSLVSRNPRAAERKQVAQLLGLWDTHLLCAIAGGGVKRFTSLSQAERERVLLSWADSRVPQRRAAFQALRKGSLLAYYGKGGHNGDRNPVWDAIGYPGPLGAAREPAGADHRAAHGHRRPHARLRRRRGRVRGRRRHRGGRPRPGGARRGHRRGGALLHRKGLRRRRVVGLRPPLPKRRRHGERRRQRRAAGRTGSWRDHAGQLHVLLPHTGQGARRVGPRARVGRGRRHPTSTRASTPSGSGSA